ncbi:peptidoglycan recognition family protein [Actinomadura sp. CNU-125]|uniref:peptidoglycan recognition protein family protein n=1 Tax=Actinomadura sp. CNU-125 TaxID=1904961 RepID=UPI0021CC8795|nr:peptidoglycan recognition family protein [Actinomadura sp. CNU-125]
MRSGEDLRFDPAPTRRTIIRGAMGAGLLAAGFAPHNGAMADELPAGGPGGLGERTAAEFWAGEPRLYTRADWDARPPKRPAEVLNRAPDHIIVHHTATANSKDRSLSHAFALSRKIQRWHMDGNGWDDAGQQLTISRGGIVMEGRNRSLDSIRAGNLAVGAQVLHHNDHTIGIENEGTYSTKGVPKRLWTSLVEVCVWLCEQYRLDPNEAIAGHRDFNNTSCPGDRLYRRLPDLRREVAARLDGVPKGGAHPETSIFPPFDPFG